CTALTDPTAVNCGAQCSSFTVALLTVVGGIVCGVLIIFPICSTLMPTTKTKIAANRPIATPKPPRVRLTLVSIEMPFATSCIRQFCLRFEQQAPQSPRHLQLSLPPLRRRPFLLAETHLHPHSSSGRNK